MQCKVTLTLVWCTCMCMWTQISKKKKQRKRKHLLRCGWWMHACMHAGVLRTMQMEDVAALYMCADGLHADADKYKERRKKTYPAGGHWAWTRKRKRKLTRTALRMRMHGGCRWWWMWLGSGGVVGDSAGASLDLDCGVSLRSHIALLIDYQTLTLDTKQHYTFSWELIKHYRQW